jgi:hypothetical protein
LKKQLAVCAGLLLLAAAGRADAQAVYSGYSGAAVSEAALPPYEIMSIVRSTGLAPLTRPMRRGPFYVLVAVDRVGRQMRVVVDARLGDIVNLRPAFASSGEPAHASALTGPALAGPALPGAEPPPPSVAEIPPRSIPDARPGAARLGAVSPPLPPLPRPRPNLASNEARAPAPRAAPAANPDSEQIE